MKKLLGITAAAALTLAATQPADAFCGFYVGGANAKLFNDATVVVMMREGTRTVLSMQNAYKGPPEKFAMVVPVPVVLQEENVKTLPRELFDKVDQLASPRLVEYWEQDPCAQPVKYKGGGGMRAAPAAAAKAESADQSANLGVKIEAQFTVGEYQIVVLSAKDSGGLEEWLHREQYTIPEGAAPYFKPYIQNGSKFFVARVDITKVKMENGMAQLSPLRFHYDSEQFSLPVRLGLINSSGAQDLIVHILAKGKRYEVANYPNVTIPTNLDVSEAAKDQFPTFYTTLFDRTTEKNPKAVVTEYSWDAASCDPCPGPTLYPNDLATLGADVLPETNAGTERRPGGPGGRGAFWGGPSFTLTRLHARYTKDSLGEDLVFKEAPAIVGGREFVNGKDGKIETGSRPAEYGGNNFQARYAVRHPWTGPIDCKEPRRGIWGGPPGGSQPATKAAQKIGLAPRDVKADLASFVKSDVPEIGFAKGASAPANASSPSTPSVSSGSGCGAGCATNHEERKGAYAALCVALLAFVAIISRRRNAP